MLARTPVAMLFVAAFRRGLVQTGYTEGQNVTIDYRWGRNQPGQLVEAAKALVQRGVSVLVASGGNQALDAAKAATVTIPIVVTFGSDPVETGPVSSLNRPEGNLTGVSVFPVQLVAKQLQLARELAPKAQTIAFLENPTNSAAKIGRDEIEAAGRNRREDCDTRRGDRSGRRRGLYNTDEESIWCGNRSRQIRSSMDRESRWRWPGAVRCRESSRREFVLAGGLISYGSSLTEAYRHIGTTPAGVLRAISRPICRSCSRPNTSLWST